MTKLTATGGRSASSARVLNMTYIALMAVVMAICSWISIPMAVPFTLQTFAVYAALLILGGRRGTAAIGLYLALGAIGVPVFAGFSGGLGVLVGPTGGYLVGFLMTGLTYWLVTSLSERPAARAVGIALGILVLYVFGTVWFMCVYARGGEAVGLMTALSWCVFPFLVPEVGKVALAFALAQRLRPLAER